MLVVSDTTPLNYLVQIEHETILPALFGFVLVPSQVILELRHSQTPRPSRDWAHRLPDWVHIQDEDPSEFPSLDPGEAAALSLAINAKADAFLADDEEARSAARQMDIRIIGTLGVLGEAHKAGLLDFEEAVARLRKTKFYLTEAVVAEVRGRL